MGSSAVITLNVADDSKTGTLINLPASGDQEKELDFVEVSADTFPAGYTYNIKVQPFEPGEVLFPPFKYVVGQDTIESNVLSLKVMPVGLDSLDTINPLAAEVNPPRRWYDYIPDWTIWVLLGLIFVALVIAAAYLYRKNGPKLIVRQKPVDPYQEAIHALIGLKEKKLAESGREKEYYTKLVDILRTYLQRRFNINAMEMSTTQILDSLRHNPDTKDNQPRIKQILQLADFVKFANLRPLAQDNLTTFQGVMQFVEDTRPVAPEATKQGQDPSPSTKK